MSLSRNLSILKRSLTPNHPYHVQWFLTRQCNYRCRGCNVWRDEASSSLSTDEVKEGLDVLRKMGVMEVVLSGGNPLLREDIGEIVSYAHRYFITTIYDNGSLAFSSTNILHEADFVAISLDTLNEELADYVKGVSGSWRNAMRSIRALHSEGIRVAVSPTISQLNLNEVTDLTRHFVDQGIPVWYCLYGYEKDSDRLFPIGRKQDEFVIMDNERFVKLCDELKVMKRQQPGILITDKTLQAVKELYLTGRRTWKCRALRNFFVIDHQGMVAPCHCVEPSCSVFDLPDEWNSSRFEELRLRYNQCTRCTYLCYIFYSLHDSISGNTDIVLDQFRNIKSCLF